MSTCTAFLFACMVASGALGAYGVYRSNAGPLVSTLERFSSTVCGALLFSAFGFGLANVLAHMMGCR